MVTITLPPELEQIVTQQAQQRGTTPDLLALDTLTQLYLSPPLLPDKEREEEQARAYREMAADEMREAEALAWSEGTLEDVVDATR